MIVFSRNDPSKHPMLKKLIRLAGGGESQKTLRFFYKTELGVAPGGFMSEDPVAFILGFFLFRKGVVHRRLWALEIWDEQVRNDSLVRVARNFVFKFFAFFSYYLADSVVFPSRLRMEYITKKYRRILFCDYFVVLNVPDLYPDGGGLPENTADVIRCVKEKFEVVAVYSGSLQSGRGVRHLIESVEKQRAVALLLCGNAKSTSILDGSADWRATFYLGNFPPSVVFSIYKKCNVGVLTYENFPLNTKLCAPVKIWEYVSCGLKVVGNNNYALKKEWFPFVDSYFDDSGDDFCRAAQDAVNKKSERPVLPEFDLERLFIF